uniref:Uncharacterized protein n=1 Tax=uncultured marine group II/III euryarchaeote AD1000_11_G05 TaxID=1457723 RepID=A0A075FJ63_9EURY|nr:hypothetical protein [uncultured marine group II/III euryarchaeote AD1000_11_G05]
MMSGSSECTRLVRPSMISPSSPWKVCSLRSPPLSMTAAAHRILFDWILVSRSNEKETKGVRKGSTLARSSRVHETTMSVGYRPEPPASVIRPAATVRSPVSSSRTSIGARSPAQSTSPQAEM